MTTNNAEALRALIENAMRKAFQLGQTYWQQADSDSYKENRKSADTMERFRAHLSDTLDALASQPPAVSVDEDAAPAAETGALRAEVERLNAIINAPQSDDFIRAVSTEAEHQRQCWVNDHDAGKTPADWFWLVGYLADKALHAHAAGNVEKAEHHVITTAAACANWHRAMFGATDMRPGIDGDAALTPTQDAAHGGRE